MTIDLDKLPKKFGKKLKVERAKRDLSQEGLAELANIHRNTMGSIERGEISPSLDVIARLASALNLSFAELFDFNF